MYLFIFLTVGRKMQQLRGSEIPMLNALLLILLVCILTPIFYFESQNIANYNLFFYNLLNLGEIVFYVFMLLLQVLILASAKERAELHTMQMLWLEEQRQYHLIKENIDALNIKCHDLKHQIRHLRETGQVDPVYLDDLERSVAIYNSAVRTGNETLDVVLTDKRLHCATNDIQFTCIAEGDQMDFVDVMDIFSLFGNMLDNAIEYEILLPPEKRFIHLSVRRINQLLLIHVENHFEGELEFQDGIPLTTKEDKIYHGYGMLSIRRIVEKYDGSFSISTEEQLFQVDIMLPIPASSPGEP
ncbi:MAG: sensor histidine kinase [Oscillospiraceae bacterium]|nr:sensor histidine kinase [Oscillospiraceae bacterium]